MPRFDKDKTPSLPARIYAYKARKPEVMVEEVGQQMYLSHRYKNRLIEIERERRRLVTEVLARVVPEMPGLVAAQNESEERCERLEAALKAMNSAARSRVVTEYDAGEWKVAKLARTVARAAVKAARQVAFVEPDIKEEVNRVGKQSQDAAREARGGCGLYWGNYLYVEDAAKNFSKGAPPRFRPWSRDKAICVQIQNGITWDTLLAAKDTRARVIVRPLSPDADPESRRSRETPMADLWIRVGSDDRKKPVWAVVPFRMFRKPPEDAVIKWVRVHRFTVGSQDCWEVQFVVTRKDWVKPDNADGGIAGIDLNWRVTPDGIRVATLVGDDGRERTLTLPWDLISGWEKAESLQSIRDQNFDEARERLADWLQDREGLPGWVEERMSTLRTWKSCARLATQVRWWASNRFDGDEEMFAAMWAWRKQENHLHDWQDNQLNKSIRRRNETYRRFAAIVRREYQTVRVEDMNLHKMARRPGPDEKSDAAAKAYARVASVGTLRQYLREAVTAIELVPAALTTLTCFSCGTVNQFDAAQELIHTCSGCGEMWDQDRCAAINLLRQMNEFGPFEVREPDLVGGPRAAG